MTNNPLFLTIRQYLLEKNIRRAAVFGSYARNEAAEQSDIDLLIDADGLTLFDILRMEEELQQLTGRKMDLVEYKAIKSTIRERVLADQVPLL